MFAMNRFSLELRNFGSWLHYFHLDMLAIGLAALGLALTGIAGRAELVSFGLRTPGSAAMDTIAVETRVTGTAARPMLSPAMSGALETAAQRYRVSSTALAPVFEVVQATSRELGLDPVLVVAVIAVESRFNPMSESPLGALGLMQVIPRFHKDKLEDESPGRAADKALLDPATNVRVGSRILSESIRRQGGLVEGLQYYAGATDDADRGYSTKVLAEKQRLEQVPRRREPVAAAPGD